MVTVSIVSHGQGELLQPLLAQLIGVSGDLPLKILVTLNLPEPLFVTPSSGGADVEIIHNHAPRGFGENHNAAFRRCDTPYFCVLNPDVRLDAGVLEVLMAIVRQSPGVAGPRVVAPDGRIEDSARLLPTPLRLFRRRLADVNGPDYSATVVTQPVAWLAGMCMLFDAESYRLVGGFNERYFLYCEDVDVCLRLQLAGRTVTWTQDAAVLHDARRASHRNYRYMGWHLRSLIRLWCSRPFWAYLLRAPTFVVGKDGDV